jgi:hypothetical protein
MRDRLDMVERDCIQTRVATSPTESLTSRGDPHLQVGCGCTTTGTAADSGKVTPLLTIQGSLRALNASSMRYDVRNPFCAR